MIKSKKQKEQRQRLAENEKRFKQEKADTKRPFSFGPNSALSVLEAWRLTRAYKKAKRDGKIPKNTHDTIPFRQMYRDGICQLDEHHFSKSILYHDINYHLSKNEDKTAIFEGWCDFLNYQDSSIHFQLSFVNLRTVWEEYSRSVQVPKRKDAFNGIRAEFVDFLQNQLAKGNNGLKKTKCVTFTIEAENLKAAKLRLERVESDILGNFKALGAQAYPMDGYERLTLLHRCFHGGDRQKFRFNWSVAENGGIPAQDFIAPDSFYFNKNGRFFKMGQTFAAASFLQILAPELTDRMLAEFLDMEFDQIVTLHLQAIDQAQAIKTVKRKITDIDSMAIDEQKKAVRSGYDIDFIPTDIKTYGEEAKNLLEDLQSRNERLFLVTILFEHTASSKQKLEENIFQSKGIAQKYNCQLRRLDYQQECGMVSSLPLGINQIEIQRGLTTSSAAIFIPFTTTELFQKGEALYYGLNALSNNLIMADRKRLKCPNGLILGTPGSGKSFSAKREITNVFLTTDDEIIVVDPESEVRQEVA